MPLNAGVAFPVTIRVSAENVDKAEQSVRRLGTTANSARQQFANLAGAFTGLFAARMVAQGIAGLMKPTIDFETAIERIGAMTNIGRGELEKFRAEAKSVAAITPYGPQEMAEALLNLQRATGSSEVALRALRPTAQLAMASFDKMTVEQSSKMMGQMITGFHLSGEEATQAAERLMAISKAGGIGIENFSNIMGKLATARTLGGQSLEEMAMAFALARKEISSSERGATELIRALSDIGSPKTISRLEQLGVVMRDQFTKQPLAMSQIMVQLSDRYKSSTHTVISAVNEAFGGAAARPILAMLGQLSDGIKDMQGNVLKGKDAYDYLTSSWQNSKGILNLISERYLGTTAAKLSEMLENARLAGMAIGQLLVPALAALFDHLRSLASAFTKLVDNPVGKIIFGTVGYLAVGAASLWALTAAFKGLASIIRVVSVNIGLASVQMSGQFVTGAERAGAAAAALRTKLSTFKGITGAAATAAAVAAPFLLPGAEENSKKYEAWAKYAKEQLQRRGSSMGLLERAGANVAAQNVLFIRMIGSDQAFDALKAVSNYQKMVYERAAQAMKESSELAKANWKEVYDYMVMGSKEMDNAIKKLKGIGDYQPPVVKMQYLEQMRSQLGVALKTAKGGDATEIQSALHFANVAEKYAVKAAKGELSPDEYTKFMAAVSGIGATGGYLSTISPGGPISKTLLKNYRKNVIDQVAGMSSATNIATNQLRLGMRQGATSVGAQRVLQGWDPRRGAYAGGVGALPAFAEGELFGEKVPSAAPSPQSSAFFRIEEEKKFTRAGPEYLAELRRKLLMDQSSLSATLKEMMAQNKEIDGKMVQELFDIKRALQGTLRVENTGKDPMAKGHGFFGSED